MLLPRNAWLVVATSALLQVGCASTAAAPPVNFLPISQIEASGAALPTEGYLSTGQPDAAVLSTIASAGYVGVVDLRTPGEDRGFDEPAAAASLGLRYEALPVAGSADVSYENAARLDALLASFDGPVLLHCGSGNRVGALFALRAKAAGATDEEAIAAGRAAGLTQLESLVRERIAEKN